MLFLITTILVLMAQDWLLKPDMTQLAQGLGDTAPDTSDQRNWVRIGLTLGLNVLFIEYSIYLTVLLAALVLPALDHPGAGVLAQPVGQLVGVPQWPHHKISALAGCQRATVLQAQRPCAVDGEAAQRFFRRQAEQGAGHVHHQQR